MAKQIQYRRGTTAEHAAFTGATGELTVDTTKQVAVVHDGVTTGGFPLASARDATAANLVIAQLTGSINQINANVAAANIAIASGSAVAAVNANVAASNARIAVLETTTSVNSNLLQALVANATVQQNQIDGLSLSALATNVAWQSNTAGLYTSIEAINSNVGNLAAVSSSINPSANVTYDLGTSNRGWRNGYFAGNVIFADNTRQRTAWQFVSVPSTSKGQTGDVAGSFAANGTYLYYCTATYTDGVADIWKRVLWSVDTW